MEMCYISWRARVIMASIATEITTATLVQNIETTIFTGTRKLYAIYVGGESSRSTVRNTAGDIFLDQIQVGTSEISYWKGFIVDGLTIKTSGTGVIATVLHGAEGA